MSDDGFYRCFETLEKVPVCILSEATSFRLVQMEKDFLGDACRHLSERNA